MQSAAKVQFWGTRGSIAKPGPHTLRYGGNTSCVQVTSPNGTLIIIDCGTGAHDLGQSLLAKAHGLPLHGSILISHTHWDHIQGFPFFAPLFVHGGHWDIYGPTGLGQSLRDTLAGQMEHTYFPVTLDDMGASIHFHDLVEGTLDIGDVHITTRYLNHPALTLGYRLEMGGASVVYACDHEPHARGGDGKTTMHELDLQHIEFLEGADLVIHDAQYTDCEYPKRRGWGHSPVEYVSEVGQLAGVKQMAFTHHDPCRTDAGVDEIAHAVQHDLRAVGSPMHMFPAADGLLIELPTGSRRSQGHHHSHSANGAAATPLVEDTTLVLGITDEKVEAAIADAIRSVSVRTTPLTTGEAILNHVKATPPALVVVEHRPDEGGIDGLALCRALRSDPDAHVKEVPVILVADRERAEDGRLAGVTQWLITPFSPPYARAQIQARLLRSACRWHCATLPACEEERLAALRALSILDTPPEERFDRITRVAAATANVPIVLVSLVDRERQWFKSCIGQSSTGSTREESFCAHAVTSRSPVIVPDTLLDDRFADNPLVLGGPRIRFYAGFPVYDHKGFCLGTLCLIDTRPRQFPEIMLQRFEDLASLVQQELNAAGPAAAPRGVGTENR